MLTWPRFSPFRPFGTISNKMRKSLEILEKVLRAEREKEIQVGEIKSNISNVLPIDIEDMILPLPQIIT